MPLKSNLSDDNALSVYLGEEAWSHICVYFVFEGNELLILRILQQ